MANFCGLEVTIHASAGVGGVGENNVGGILQARAVRLLRTSEVTPTGMGIRAAVHP